MLSRSVYYWMRTGTSEPLSRSKNVENHETGCVLRQESWTCDRGGASADTLYRETAALWESLRFNGVDSFSRDGQTTSLGEDGQLSLLRWKFKWCYENIYCRRQRLELRVLRRDMWSETDCHQKRRKKLRQTSNNLKSCKQKIIVHFSKCVLILSLLLLLLR